MLVSFILPNFGGLKHRVIWRFFSRFNWLIHFFQSFPMFCGTWSSHLQFLSQCVCIICFPLSRKDALRPSGSWMKLRVDNIPLLVNGFSLMTILNPRVSASTFYKIPNACSSGTLQPRSLSLTPFVLKVSGIECRTFLLLLTNFVKLNPPSLHIDLTFLISLMASSSELTDFNISST